MEVILDHISRAKARRDNPFLDRVARDVLECYRDPPEARATLVAAFLNLTQDRSQFRRYTIYALLKDLVESGNTSMVPTKTLISLTDAIMHRTPDPNCDALIYTKVAPILAATLVEHREKQKYDFKKATGGLTRQQIVWELFKIIRKLLDLQRPDDVMPIFQNLANSGFVPEAAMQDLPKDEFAPIVLTVILRCCLEWKWYTRAAYVLLNTPQWDKSRSVAFDSAVAAVVEHVLLSEEEPQPNLASAIVVRILNNPNVIVLSDHTLSRFYDLMEKYNQPQFAEAVYRLTQSPQIKALHVYPPPRGKALPWLLESVVAKKNAHTARLLVTHVVDADEPIPPLSRRLFVSNAAEMGFLGPARTLWERFNSEPSIRADGNIMMRLVSAFANRTLRLQVRMEASNRPHPTETSSSVLVSNAQAKAAASGDAASPEDVIVNELDVDVSNSNEALEDEHETRTLQEQIDDHRAFADLVVQAFRTAHEPLIRAAHHDLNALARAYMILGRVEDGFEVLRNIVERKEVPDVHDANVALSALSAVSPARAARMIDRMVAMGLHPDAVSFGTVIHRAVLKGDVALVTALILRARQLNIRHLSYKTVGTLIRACVAAPEGEGQPDKTQLENAKDLVDSLIDADFVPSPAMGSDCVTAALRARDPAMAFRFWKLLVKDKVEWQDGKRQAERERIAQEVRRHWAAGWLDENRARVMLYELGVRARQHGEHGEQQQRRRRSRRQSSKNAE